MRELPGLVVLGLVALSLGVVALDAWQTGVTVLGGALLLGGALRLSLPGRTAGLLAVRSRGVDALVLLGLGIGVVLLGNAVPTG